MKGHYTLQILEKIGETIASATDILRVIVEHPNRNALFTKSIKNLATLKRTRGRNKETRKEYCRRIKRYQNLIAWLKRDGIIKESIIKNQSFLGLTRKGKKYREALLKRQEGALPRKHYAAKKSKNLMVLSFDIPEKKRAKRAWLREALRNIGLRMIQQSVWLGYVRIPEELLADLRQLQIIDHIEIFTVTKKGSLRKFANAKNKTLKKSGG